MFNSEAPPTHMPFGKYKGTSIKDLAAKDPSYIEWILDNLSRLNDPTRRVLEKAVGRDQNTPPPPPPPNTPKKRWA